MGAVQVRSVAAISVDARGLMVIISVSTSTTVVFEMPKPRT